MDSSLCQQIIAQLEQHPECDRIKKLVNWACTKTWPPHPTRLDLKVLIAELMRLAPNWQSLNTALLTGAATLNKRPKYTEIAQLILHHLMPLYTAQSELNPRFGGSYHPPIPTHCSELTAANDAENDPDVFEIRLAIMKSTIPLKAKLLISATLNGPFKGSPQDWLHLKQQPLDELLLQLSQTYTTLAELELHLEQAATHLTQLDQSSQTVQAILQALKPLYSRPTQTTYPMIQTAIAPSIPQAALPIEDPEELTIFFRPGDRADAPQVVNQPGSLIP
jgi:hypothetical protein